MSVQAESISASPRADFVAKRSVDFASIIKDKFSVEVLEKFVVDAEVLAQEKDHMMVRHFGTDHRAVTLHKEHMRGISGNLLLLNRLLADLQRDRNDASATLQAIPAMAYLEAQFAAMDMFLR